MIPLKLQLYNFMSYGSDVQPLDFRGIDLACLTGRNGVGKSSLLEAITWVLWGKARGKSDDDLIKLNQENMWVDFEFDLEGQRYRVIRKRSKRKRGQSSLEFMVAKNEKGFSDWTDLTGSSKAETQQRIIETLKMSYETFINSAFLRQGHADEFTIKRPTERKAILGDILGLSEYDLLEAQAKEISRNKEIEKQSLLSQLEDISGQILDKDKVRKELKKIERSLEGTSSQIKKKEEELIGLREKKNDLETKAKKIKELDLKIEDSLRDINELKENIQKHDRVIVTADKLIRQKEEIEKNYREYKDNLNLNEEYNKKLSKQLELSQQKREIEKSINQKRQEMELERGKITARLEEIEEKSRKKKEKEEEKIKIERELEELSKIEKEQKGLKEDCHSIEKKLAEIKGELKRTSESGEEIKKKISSLSQAKAVCPLCKQKLTEEHRIKVIKELNWQLIEKRKEYQILRERSEAFFQKKESLEEEIKSLEMRLSGRREVERRFNEIEKDLRDWEELSKRKKELIAQKLELEKKIKEKRFDGEKFKKLETIEEEIKALAYNEREHNEIKEKIKELEEYGILKTKLDQASEKKKDALAAKERIEEIIKRKEESIRRDKKKKENLAKEVEELDKLKSYLDEEERKLFNLRVQASGVEKKYGAVKEKLDRMSELEKEVKKKKKKLRIVEEEKSIYDQLAQAFSKRGIQAMIIENVLPEIEEEANKLLSKMTDGKMQIKFETQREKKTDGELQETLDIKISDEQGLRPYELYSGGEAYRINFAIRVALSKLLAHRAGAKVQFLVIDEGFGTQDTQGREHLIEVINSISSEFKKILVITHVPELRDVFPNRIEITKDEEGSHINIVT